MGQFEQEAHISDEEHADVSPYLRLWLYASPKSDSQKLGMVQGYLQVNAKSSHRWSILSQQLPEQAGCEDCVARVNNAERSSR